MTKAKAILILKRHQEWRTGKGKEMPNTPAELTEAINIVIDICTSKCIAWAVFNGLGSLCTDSIASNPEDSRGVFSERYKINWREALKQGYRCRKIKITEAEG